PRALTEPDGSLSTHPALITRPLPALPRRVVPPHRWVDPTTRRDDWAPSLPAHYRPFAPTTSPSAPLPRIGPLAPARGPLGLLPWHRGDRSPGSPFEPGSDSRHLHAGRRAGGKRMSPALIPGQRLGPGFDVVLTLSTRHRWFPDGRLSDPYLTRSRRAFSETLTTGALDPSRSRWFGACLRRPAPRGLPSSRTDIAWRTSSSPGEFHPQALTALQGSLSTHAARSTQSPPTSSRRAVAPHRWVDPTRRPDDWAPSLQAHYRPFAATTSPSVPVPRIGTLALVGLPLGLLPWHRGDRFPGSPFEPGSDSRHLHAGRHAGSKRIAPALIPEQRLDPGFDVVPMLSTRHRWFPCARLSDPYLTRPRRPFSQPLPTPPLDPHPSP